MKIILCIDGFYAANKNKRDSFPNLKGVESTMKKLVSVVAAVAMLSIASFSFAANAHGPVTKLTKNADGTYTVIVKDSKSGKEITLQVSDDETKGKFESKKIVADDDVKVKYDEKGGKNVTTSFKKAAGC